MDNGDKAEAKGEHRCGRCEVSDIIPWQLCSSVPVSRMMLLIGCCVRRMDEARGRVCPVLRLALDADGRHAMKPQ